MVIIDYPARLTEKTISKEKKKVIEELSNWMINFVKENNIQLVGENGKVII
jgi:hypothetical protein